ncbi:MAG: hypothetical protein CSA07_04975 [Bacteroidia bacterium]|nr:MAG: hypothetical protein CSA07_04975 [Bacteroidia bacterium]
MPFVKIGGWSSASQMEDCFIKVGNGYLAFSKAMENRMKTRILYVHGKRQGPADTISRTATTLRKILPPSKFKIFAPSFSEDPDEALQFLHGYIRENDIDLIIGSSLGAFITLQLREKTRIVINPCCDPAEEVTKRSEWPNDIVQKYRAQRARLYEAIKEEDRINTYALFATNDELFSFFDEYKQHYHQALFMEDGHRISEENIRHMLCPLIDLASRQIVKRR